MAVQALNDAVAGSDSHSDEGRPGFSAFAWPAGLPPASETQLKRLLGLVGFEFVARLEAECLCATAIMQHFSLVVRDDDGTAEEFDSSLVISFAVDVMPARPSEHEHVDNQRILAAHKVARYFLLSGEADVPGLWVGMTSRSSAAWDALRTFDVGAASEIQRSVVDRISEFKTDGAIADLSTWGNTAKVELIEHDGSKAIRKTFRRSALHLMQREVQVLRDLGAHMPQLPELLICGRNFIVIEYREGYEVQRRRRDQPQPLPLSEVRSLADALHTCVRWGYDPLDLKAAGNIIYQRSGITLFDFEYWRKSHPARAEDCYCIAGVPVDDVDDRPIFSPSLANPYPRAWFPYVCLSKHSFLYDPAWLQRIKRPWFIVLAHWQWARRLFVARAEHAYVTGR